MAAPLPGFQQIPGSVYTPLASLSNPAPTAPKSQQASINPASTMADVQEVKYPIPAASAVTSASAACPPAKASGLAAVSSLPVRLLGNFDYSLLAGYLAGLPAPTPSNSPDPDATQRLFDSDSE